MSHRSPEQHCFEEFTVKREKLAGSLSLSISMCGRARTDRNITDKSKERARGTGRRCRELSTWRVFVARGFSVVETEAPLRRGQRGSDGGAPQVALWTMGNVMSRRVKSQ